MKVGADSTLKIAGELSASERERLSALGLPAVDYNNTRLYLSSAAYREWVDICLYNDASRMKPDTSLGYAARKVLLLKAINEKVTAPLIKAKLLYAPTLFVLKAVKQPDVLAQVYSDLMASEASLTEKTEVTEVYQNITAYKNGSMAPDFSYADINGKMISLKSFRGKYTYIDIWATWCAPCKAEIPHLAKLEARFGKQINFISLSIDYQKDKPTWKNFVKTQHLKGIQVIADNASKSDFVKKLNIVGIPRFVLIDPEGRITAAEALFPSDPKLALQLKQLVKK
jgi:thiol-disulfide isomerase/thioredoxin